MSHALGPLLGASRTARGHPVRLPIRRAPQGRHQRGEARVIPIILRACDWKRAPFAKLQALPKDGTLLLVERLMPESPGVSDEDRAHVMSDLNMLRGPGGRERTEKQYHRLLTESGFRPTSLHPAGRFNVIESRVR